MNRIILIGLMQFFTFCLHAQTITAAEYFIDADPGVGNGTAIAVTPGSNVNFMVSLSTASLVNGFHTLAIRTKDADGKWGLYEKTVFCISANSTNASNITAAEYFIDADPGVGNGTAIAVTPGSNINFMASLSTASLVNGFHTLAIRTKDADGKWGLYEKTVFCISANSTNASNITAAEYFIDADPGVGNGTAIAVTPGSNVNFMVSLSTASLVNGFHTLAIRTKDADGKWGLYEISGLYISTQTSNSPGMAEAEFFVDTDPGVGNGTPFTIPGGQNFNQDFILPIPAGLSNGQHFIAIRVKKHWSLFAFDTIQVTGATPLELVSFAAEKRNNIVALSWVTENENNTSHFEIERSSNGTLFTSLGRVESANSIGTHSYGFNDLLPIKGMNFYRLKQVDRDGRFTHSTIIRLLFREIGTPFIIFPNPAQKYVRLSYCGRQNTVIVNIFDAQGKLVLVKIMKNVQPLQLNIEALSKGRYTIQLSDGETVASGSFIKQ